jgi:general L-amino acid transport system substrate-binding protein
LEADGTSSGFDTDFCRALAAAVLGDSDAVEFVILTAAARFEALAAGEIDVLIRNTTWTQSRDGDLDGTFATTTFYDGQGMMVRAGEFTSIDEMGGTTICSLQGTTTELNLADRFAASGLEYTGLTYEENGPLEAAFTATECDGWTSDKSQLAARRFAYPEADGGPDSLLILDEVFSKEPLGPVTRDGDTQWSDIVNWVVIGMITADEKGITSANVADFAADPGEAETARLLGVGFEGGEVFDPGLGISTDFMQSVLSQVGNYDEVYTRNVEPLGIPRAGTVNASWLDGGLIYAPPTR